MAHDDDEEEVEEAGEDNTGANEEPEADDGFGDDFDDFEAGAGDVVFGAFDGDFPTSSEFLEAQKQTPPKPSAPAPASPFVSSFDS